MDMSCDEQGGNLEQFERNKYFYGKLMTVRDFETEQNYFKEKDHLINRLIHGVGIVCGLKIVSISTDETEGIKVKISPGVAIDCCGREIIVDKEEEHSVNGTFDDENGINCLYLRYKECEKESVPVLSNTSSCEETCCNNRIKEVFDLEWGSAPEIPLIDLEANSAPAKDLVQKYYEDYLSECPKCADAKVLLNVINESGNNLVKNETETKKYRAIVYNNPLLYELLNSHMMDFSNPHKVTAEQTKSLVSVEGLSNPGGNIDLESKNAIKISTQTKVGADPQIIIGEEHSAIIGNPHKLKAADIGALVSLKGLKNPGGNIDLAGGNGIEISTENLKDVDPKITISSKVNSEILKQLELISLYLRERALKHAKIGFGRAGDKFKGYSAGIGDGISEIFYKFSQFFKEIEGEYKDPDAFVEAMIKADEYLSSPDLRKLLTALNVKGAENFISSMDNFLEIDYKQDDSWIRFAVTLDEICFYVSLLEFDDRMDILSQYLRERALKCTVISFRELVSLDSGEVNKITQTAMELFKAAVEGKIYLDPAKFVDFFAKRVVKILNSLLAVLSNKEVFKCVENLEQFGSSIKDLSAEVDNQDSLKIAAAMDEVCFYVQLLRRC
jgi:hypothetical protein